VSRLSPRRVAIALAVLIAVLVVLASASRTRGPVTPLPPATAATAPTTSVDAQLPADGTVRARQGELVRLHIQSPTSDVAEILALGVSTPVGPNLDAPLQFVADQPGTFAIMLRYAGETVGRVVVSAG
jgi:hypothetical protein